MQNKHEMNKKMYEIRQIFPFDSIVRKLFEFSYFSLQETRSKVFACIF